MRTIPFWIVRGFIFLAIFILSASSGIFAAAEYVPGELLVKFKDTSPSSSSFISSIHTHVGSQQKKKFKKLKIHHMKLPEDLSVEAAVAAVSLRRLLTEVHFILM